MDKVSIIVPVYKCQNYIEKCVQSILNQKYKNIELILILDGVFDQSVEICRKYAKDDSRIIVVEKQNEGVSIARNTGIEKCTGKWICFIDSDDWIEENYISFLVEEAQKYNYDIFICGYYTEYGNKRTPNGFFSYNEHLFTEEDRIDLIKSCIINTDISNKNSTTNVGVPWAKIYKTDFIKENNLKFVPGLKRMQDMVFNINAFSVANKIAYKEVYLYHYLKNPQSSTVAYRSDYSDTMLQVDAELKKFIKKYNQYCSDEVLFCKEVLLITEMIKLQFAHPQNKKSLRKKKKNIMAILKKSEFLKNIKKCKGKYLNNNQKLYLIMLQHNVIYPLLIYKILECYKEKRIIQKNI